MSTNVLLRVIVPLINAVRPDITMQDPWGTGRMQHLLRQSARHERIIQTVGHREARAECTPDELRTQQPTSRGKRTATRTTDQMGTTQTQILRARRHGAIYEEIFQILGPGITPRQLAGCPWSSSPPPRHCKSLREIIAAVRSGDPMPRPPVEGWARQDLACVRDGLWHIYGALLSTYRLKKTDKRTSAQNIPTPTKR